MKRNSLLYLTVVAMIILGCEKVAPRIPVSGVTLNKATTTIIIDIENSETLTATIEPDNATNKEAIWSSSNRSVAVVDQGGIVTAVAEGTAIISITTLDGYYSANCTIMVGSAAGAPNIVITTESTSITLSLQGLSTVLIEWGDGTHDKYTPPDFATFSHAYTGALSRTITLSGANIARLNCFDYPLTGLDLHENTTLTHLNCSNAQLTSLNLLGCTALLQLACSGNQITNIDVSGCSEMSSLECNNNRLTRLNMGGCSVLKTLLCAHNHLTNLDMSGYTLLEELDCSHNLLISLNVSGCTALEGLDCSYNQLANVDVNKNAALKRFDCSRNQLTSLDVSGCPVLISLNCRYNYMDANMLNTLFRTLNRLPLLSKVIYIGNNGPNYDGSGTAGCDQRLAHNFDRGGLYWTVYE